MRRITTSLIVGLVAMLVLASCGSSIADMQEDVRAAAPAGLDDDQLNNLDDWTECMLNEVGLKKMREAFSGDELNLSAFSSEDDENCLKTLGLNDDLTVK